MANGQLSMAPAGQLSLSPADQQRIRLAQSMQQQGMRGQNRTPLETIGNTLMNIQGQRRQESVLEDQEQRRQAYADTMRRVSQAGQEGIVTGPGGGGTGEVATPRQRMIDALSSNPDTAPTAAQLQLSQALQPEQARTQTISGEQANRMFGTQLSPGAAVTVESGPQGRRITNVQEGQARPEMDVNAQFQALNKETGERETLLRTNRGLVKQTVGEDGQARFTPVDSSRYRPVDTQETGTSQELSGLGSTERRNLNNAEVASRELVSTTSDAIDMLNENPDINTFTGRAASLVNDLQQEGKALARGMGLEFEEDTLDPSKYSDSFDRLGIENARMRSLVTSLAFQAAAATGQTGRSVSDRDVQRFIEEVGASSADPRAFKETLRDVANRSARRFQTMYEVKTNQPYEGNLGLERLQPSEAEQTDQGGGNVVDFSELPEG